MSFAFKIWDAHGNVRLSGDENLMRFKGIVDAVLPATSLANSQPDGSITIHNSVFSPGATFIRTRIYYLKTATLGEGSLTLTYRSDIDQPVTFYVFL